jgi:glucosylceramidase
MINGFNNRWVGWADWNILLDEARGPNHVKNLCFTPVHADKKAGQMIYTNSYYCIRHFSKFVCPGAKRIASSPSRSQLLSTAFSNPTGKVSVVVLNRADQKVSNYNLVAYPAGQLHWTMILSLGRPIQRQRNGMQRSKKS